MKKNKKIGVFIIASFSAVALLSTLIGTLSAQGTKQLKTPNPQQPVTVANPQEKGDTQTVPETGQTTIPEQQLDDNSIVLPQQGSQSYSVVIESKTGPDGKLIRTKKIWKDGKLIEETEETGEPGSEDDSGTTIELSDGFTIPGTILRSEHFGDFPFGDGNPFERAEQFFQQQRQRMEELQKQWGGTVVPGQTQGIVPQGSVPQAVHVATPSKYWIGVSVRLVPEMLASQLNLPQDVGVIVTDVLPGYAAEKAGIQKFDIIMKIGSEDVNDIQEIGTILDATPEQTVKMELYRNGKKMTIDIKPMPRPESPQALKIIGPAGANASDNSIRIVRPGFIVPKNKAIEYQEELQQQDKQQKAEQSKGKVTEKAKEIKKESANQSEQKVNKTPTGQDVKKNPTEQTAPAQPEKK